MESKTYLSAKNCACCTIRLDKLPKRDVRRVSESDLNTLNTVKPIILTNKKMKKMTMVMSLNT
jgi:hypothetical protein